ncbi:MAG: hypothetical protein IKB55_01455 [Clostridia bacterium]|nr:hypothetical protein [Clostridia bacterium]
MGKTKKLMAKIPIIFLLSGGIICAVLMVKSLMISGGTFDYHRHVLSHQLYQAIIFICAECGVAAIWFEYLRIKSEKQSE